MVDFDQTIDRAVAWWLLKHYDDLGIAEPIGENTINRFVEDMQKSKPEQKRKSNATEEKNTEPSSRKKQVLKATDPVVVSQVAAAECLSLEELRKAMEDYSHCELRNSAKNLVFSDGNPKAHVLLVGEAPGGEEDRVGKPFVGQSGRLLDLMFNEIGLCRDSDRGAEALYIINVLPWRPPGNRNPTASEVAMMSPFTRRHIELVQPKLLVAIGSFSCALLVGKTGITRLRGHWHYWQGIPVMPMFHPAYLLRSPSKKAESWNDLMMIRKKLSEL